jgi:indolepyruvate decarboxylase
MRLTKGVLFIGQPLRASIGYTLPVAFGAQTAAPERRVVLLIRDGAAQLTAQGIGLMLRDGVKPIIVLLNNGGYTIERVIHSPAQRYHDIASRQWSLLTQAMGAETRSLALPADTAETPRPLS